MNTEQEKGAGVSGKGDCEMVQRGEGLRFHLPDEGGEDLFVRYTGVAGSGFRSLEEGERVSYEPTTGRRAGQAENVRRIG